MKKFIPALFWALLIGGLSLMPSSDIPEINFLGIPHVDKIGHSIFYGILSLLLCYGFASKIKSHKSILWKSGIISIIYGIFLETLQYFMSFGRAFEILDIIANISGAFIGILVFNHFRKYI